MMHYGLFGGVPATDDPVLLKKLDGYRRGLKKPPIAGASDLWAIGRVDLAGGQVVDMPVTWDEIHRDEAWAAGILDLIGVKKGDICFYSFLYGQSAQFWPLMKATFDRGARSGSGMPTAWDSYRLETYMRLFKLKMDFGISPATLDGLEAAGHDLARVFSGVDVLVALPGAWERLVLKGFKPWRITWLGPVLAIDPCDGSGGRYDWTQWTLQADDGEILVSSAPCRTAKFLRARTGTSGEIRVLDGEPRFISLS